MAALVTRCCCIEFFPSLEACIAANFFFNNSLHGEMFLLNNSLHGEVFLLKLLDY